MREPMFSGNARDGVFDESPDHFEFAHRPARQPRRARELAFERLGVCTDGTGLRWAHSTNSGLRRRLRFGLRPRLGCNTKERIAYAGLRTISASISICTVLPTNTPPVSSGWFQVSPQSSRRISV